MLNDSSESIWNRVRYLPTKDTLVVASERFGGEYALITPIEKGRSWVSGYIGDEPAWKATILERFAYRKIEGTVYENVVAVKYQRVDGVQENEEWIRFYAEGVGAVLTIKNVYPISSFSEETIPQQKQRVVLLETCIAN